MTPARRAHLQHYMARRRAHWTAAGLCTDCGAARRQPFLRCGLCLTANRIRWDRKSYKLRMAKAKLKNDPLTRCAVGEQIGVGDHASAGPVASASSGGTIPVNLT